MNDKNRMGTGVSAQVSNMGAIDISLANFTKDEPFCIKNDNDDAVTLEVTLWDMEEGTFISTKFEHGWNPEIIRTVKQKASTNNLKWGL